MRYLSYIPILGLLLFTSCEPDQSITEPLFPTVEEEASTFPSTIVLESTDFIRREVVPLDNKCGSSYYTSGKLEYFERSLITATIEFYEAEVDPDKMQSISERFRVRIFDMRGELDRALIREAGSESRYHKAIVEPLVKGRNCPYIVSGIVEFKISSSVVATVDYGDGTCDDVATITTKDGSSTFLLFNDQSVK